MGLSGVGASGGAGAVQAPEQGPATTSTAQDLGDQAKEKVAANAGNIDKGQGEAEKLAAEKKIKSGKAVQGVGIGMTTAAGLMASAATVAAPAFPIGTITAAFVYAASAVLAIVGAVTTFVGNRMIKGGEGAVTDSLNTISKGVDKSDSAVKNAKASKYGNYILNNIFHFHFIKISPNMKYIYSHKHKYNCLIEKDNTFKRISFNKLDKQLIRKIKNYYNFKNLFKKVSFFFISYLIKFSSKIVRKLKIYKW